MTTEPIYKLRADMGLCLALMLPFNFLFIWMDMKVFHLAVLHMLGVSLLGIIFFVIPHETTYKNDVVGAKAFGFVKATKHKLDHIWCKGTTTLNIIRIHFFFKACLAFALCMFLRYILMPSQTVAIMWKLVGGWVEH